MTRPTDLQKAVLGELRGARLDRIDDVPVVLDRRGRPLSVQRMRSIVTRRPAPSKWPRRESEKPAVVRHSRGHGRPGAASSPGVVRLHREMAPDGRAKTNDLLNHRASRTMAKGHGWYRSKNGGRWHDIRRKTGEAVCGATPLRAAGQVKKAEVPEAKMCRGCGGDA